MSNYENRASVGKLQGFQNFQNIFQTVDNVDFSFFSSNAGNSIDQIFTNWKILGIGSAEFEGFVETDEGVVVALAAKDSGNGVVD